MDKKTLYTIYISIGLAALASIPWNPIKGKWLPIILNSIFILFTSSLIIIYLKEKLSFKIIFNKDKAFAQVQKIYLQAQQNGGELFTTHIYPIERLPDDKLTDTFNNVKKYLYFHRLVYTDDPFKLDKVIRSTFEIKSKNLDVEVLVPSSSTFVPKFIWYILPRVNIVSYYNSINKTAMSSVGIFRIYTDKNVKSNSIPITPTIHFFTKRVVLFKKIKEYFRAFNYGHSSHFNSLEEYEQSKSKIMLQAKYKSFISHLLFLCDNPNLGILNISLFGQYASFQKGVFDIGSLKIDFDIDLLIVCEKGKKEKVRSEITSELANIDFTVNLIWGPINDDFYSKRSTNIVYIDIELFEENDDYYRKNSLLGYSIIPACLGIYMQDQSTHRLHQILQLPEPIANIKKRAKILLESRKGLNDFKNSIIKYDGQFDPIRVISHIIRNTSWVITGYFEPSYDKTYEIIMNSDIELFEKEFIHSINELVKKRDYISYNEQYIFTSKLLEQAINSMNNFLDS